MTIHVNEKKSVDESPAELFAVHFDCGAIDADAACRDIPDHIRQAVRPT